jgi:hypothetical protein
MKLFRGLTFLLLVSISGNSFAQMKMKPSQNSSIASKKHLQTEMRELWAEHILWTRNVVLCLVDNLPGRKQSVKRLLQNQVDIGNIYKPYYGNVIGEKLTTLLLAHINISEEVINAAKLGNKIALDKANLKWFANGNEIVVFLNKINPQQRLADLKTMMDNHLKWTTDMVNCRIKKDYDTDIIAYDKVNKEILSMADMLSEAIIKQFPKQF